MSLASEEQRLGRLVVRRPNAHAAGDGAPETRPLPLLQLSAAGPSWIRRHPRARAVVFSLVGFKVVALLVFAIASRHSIALFAALAELIAFALLVALSRGPASASVRVDGDQIIVNAGGNQARYPLDRVEQVSVGEDGSFRTVWARVGAGRVLLMERLAPDEAELAVATLRAVLAGQKPA